MNDSRTLTERYHPQVPWHISLRHAPRWYSRGCENALYLVQALFVRQNKPEKRLILDVIKAAPEIIDILFEVASQPRTPWHPESHTQETACECLVALFSFPTDIVPGLPFDYSDAPEDKAAQEEWDQTLRALEILTSRQGYREGIIRVFKILDDEEPEWVLRCVNTVDQLFARNFNDEIDRPNEFHKTTMLKSPHTTTNWSSRSGSIEVSLIQ